MLGLVSLATQAKAHTHVSLVALVQEPFAVLVFTLVNSYASAYAYVTKTQD